MATYATYVGSTSHPNLSAIGRVGTFSGRNSTVESRAHGSRNESRKSHSRNLQTVTPHGTLKTSYTRAPTPKEEDLESVLDISESEVPYDETGKRCYARACKKLDVVPSSYILAKLANSKAIDCKHYGLGPKGTMALAIALVVNSRVTSLNLQGNDIGRQGILYLQKMISESHTLTELNVSDNKLGSTGAHAIQKMLLENRSLTRLEMSESPPLKQHPASCIWKGKLVKLTDALLSWGGTVNIDGTSTVIMPCRISGNDFTDSDAILLAKPIQDHPELEHVDLSHNLFGDKSAELFEEMISENSAIHTLDLSWNQFRTVGAKFIAKGLKENVYIKTLNVSWNGFGDEGATEFAKALKVNSVLNNLDLTCCRIGHDGFMKIITALNLNESLLHLRIGKNNIPEEFAEAALSMLRSYPAIKLETLDMADCTFSPKFETHVQELNQMHRHINIIYGYNTSYGKSKGDLVGEILKEGLQCLSDFCKENGVSLVELFERFDTDNSMSVTLQEFQDGLKEAGVPLSLYKIEMFANALDKDGDGEVDYSEMVLQLKGN